MGCLLSYVKVSDARLGSVNRNLAKRQDLRGLWTEWIGFLGAYRFLTGIRYGGLDGTGLPAQTSQILTHRFFAYLGIDLGSVVSCFP
jgi:hypothetical protein